MESVSILDETIFLIYDLPTWVFGLLSLVSFAMAACGGLALTRGYIRKHIQLGTDTNDTVNAYFAGIGVFYGLLLGLIAVATWQSYDDSSGLIAKEAAKVGVLYRMSSSYPQPYKGILQTHLLNYATSVVENDWPAQQRGRILTSGTAILTKFQKTLMSIEPVPGTQTILHAETLRCFNNLIEARRLRLDAVTGGLPGVLWSVMLIGGLLSIFVTYFFHVESYKLHQILTGTLGMFIGMMVFLTAVVDNPYRGEVSVTPESYVLIIKDTMAGDSPPVYDNPPP